MNSGSLRDQLKALGLVKPPPKPDPAAPRDRQPRKPHPGPKPSSGVKAPSRTAPPAQTAEEISLAKAYAARQAAEQAEAAALRRQQEEKARQKRERKAAAVALLEGKSLIKPDAELPRHFEYGKKIRRIYVDAEQLKALNAGQLGIAQLDGRFLLVDQATIETLQRVAPEFVALRVDPDHPVTDDLAIPPDLHW